MVDLQSLKQKVQARLDRVRQRFRAVDIAVATFQRFSQDDGGSYAAALTYYMFFSIFPLLMFAAAVLGYVTVNNQELRDELIKRGVNAAPILRDALRPDGVDGIIENRRAIALSALGLALYSGSGAVVALEHALNKLHHLEHEPGFLAKRLRSLKWLGILGVGALLAIATGAVAGFTRQVLGEGAAGAVVATIAAAAGGVAVNTLVFATAYKFLPALEEGWRQVLPGAIVAGILFQILNVAGSTYLAQGETARNDTFGTFAAAATLLVASYLISQITLLSAEVNLVLAEGNTSQENGKRTEEETA